jgi:hypothetical protein
MDGFVVLLIVVSALALVGLAAVRLGAETRPGFEDPSLGRDIAT